MNKNTTSDATEKVAVPAADATASETKPESARTAKQLREVDLDDLEPVEIKAFA